MTGVAVAVAVLVNILAGLSYFQQEDTDEAESAMFDPLSPEEDEADGLVRDIEMEAVHSEDVACDVEDDQNMAELGSSANVISLEEKRGRPTVHQMLQFVDSARRPGLFTCGPRGLMQDIREHTEERCMMRLQQCMRDASHHIAVYEEAFNM